MNALRYGSAISQLENDQYAGDQGDDAQRAFARGHNSVVRRSIEQLRRGEVPAVDFVSERYEDEGLRAYSRGRNAGVRHVRHVLRIANALGDLAHAPVIETVDLGEEKP